MDSPSQQTNEAKMRLGLAALCAQLVDDSLEAFDGIILAARHGIQTAESAAGVRATYGDFASAARLLIARAGDLGQEGAKLLSEFTSTPYSDSSAKLDIRLQTVHAALLARVNIGEVNANALAEFNARQAQTDNDAFMTAISLSPGQAVQTRRLFDYLGASAIQSGILQAGAGIFPRKRAVPVLDKRTTDLCSDRMAWQVRDWSEPFVDPVTGAKWDVPPFIYDRLPPAEAFHWCRTGIEPAE